MPVGQDFQQADQAGAPKAPGTGERNVSDQDKKLSADYLKRIDAAKDRPAVKEAFKTFERNRKLLRGYDPSKSTNEKMRSNLHFANLAMMRPQVYAKDPEFSVTPTNAVGDSQMDAATKFCRTAECVLTEKLVKGAKLKKRAKRLLTSAFTTSIGWWKLSWQEDRKKDPLILDQLKDTQDNIERIKQMREDLGDPSKASDMDLQLAKLREAVAGLERQSEIVVARGLALDFLLSEDVLILDDSVREIGDYERSAAMAHGAWLTRDAFQNRYGFSPAKAKTYTEQSGQQSPQAGQSGSNASQKGSDLLRVWEIWDQQLNRVFVVCEGLEGFCTDPFSPDWTGERWIPFFLLAFNEIDGSFYPLSDIELTEPLVREYNESRDDFVKDRRDSRPFTVIRKGGSLTEDDVKAVRNRQGNDVVMVNGVGGQSIGNDIQAITLGHIDAANYNTQPARADMEMIIGGGDAARGSVLEAKTATEAEILSQGLRGRSAERTDIMEDLITDLGVYGLEIMLRKMTQEEVQRIAGPEAHWPTLSIDDVFEMVQISVRGGSTGKPDRLQEQDRWTKLQPVIQETIQTVADLYSKGQTQLGQALSELLRETLRRFDERIDIDSFLPQPPKDGQPDAGALAQENAALKEQLKAGAAELEKKTDMVEKGLVSACAQVATSAQPMLAMQVLQQALIQIGALANDEETPMQGDQSIPQQMAGAPMESAQVGDMPDMPGMQMPAMTPDQTNAPQSAPQT